MWKWLGKAANQKVLAFIGTGIAGFVALLIQLGIVNPSKPAEGSDKPTAEKPERSSPATPAAPTQTAEASNGSSVVQIQGNNNQTNAGKPTKPAVKSDTPAKKKSESPAPTSPRAPAQRAEAGNGSTVIQIQGDNNRTSTGK